MRALLTLASACCLLLLSACGGSDQPTAGSRTDGIATDFEVLRGPAEQLPAALARHVDRVLGRNGGPDPADTQLVDTPEGRIWLFRYGKQLCLAQTGRGAASCSTAAVARSRGVVLGTFSPPTEAIPHMHGFLMIGAMPDGVGSVEATIGRGMGRRHVTVPVFDNVFAIAAQRPIFISDRGR